MRRYLQGTLDFACGIYAVINALSLIEGIDLAAGRHMLSESHVALAARPELFAAFARNETDHYWLVRYMLRRWCAAPPHALRVVCPHGAAPPSERDLALEEVPLYLPERLPPEGAPSAREAGAEAALVRRELQTWFSERRKTKRAALLRFHRFLPGVPGPVISHWTCASDCDQLAVHLHDASSDANSLRHLEHRVLNPDANGRPMARIVPESLYLLENAARG